MWACVRAIVCIIQYPLLVVVCVLLVAVCLNGSGQWCSVYSYTLKLLSCSHCRELLLCFVVVFYIYEQKSWRCCWLCFLVADRAAPDASAVFMPASSATATVGVATSAVVADVALTREAGKNAKLAALLEDAGISSVEVMKAKPYFLHRYYTLE